MCVSVSKAEETFQEAWRCVHHPRMNRWSSLHPALCRWLWKCGRPAPGMWWRPLDLLRFTYMVEHAVWQHDVRVPCANAAYLFIQLDLKRIGRSREMFSLHRWGSPLIVASGEAEACHGCGSALFRQHSISSMYFVNKRFGFPARWMCTSKPILRWLGPLCLKQQWSKPYVSHSYGSPYFIALHLCVKLVTRS